MCGFKNSRKTSVFVKKLNVFVKWIEVDSCYLYTI